MFGQIFSFQAISVWLGFVKNGFQFHSVINHFGFHIKRLVNAVFSKKYFSETNQSIWLSFIQGSFGAKSDQPGGQDLW